MGLFFVLIFFAIAVPTWGFVACEMPWLLERNPPERKALLAMLRELAADEWAWERNDRTWRHKDSGVSIVRPPHSYRTYRLLAGQVIEFDRDTRGGRICKQIIETVAAREKREADTLALKNMNEAFRRMNG